MLNDSPTSTPTRVVFDANLAISAVLSGSGPAFECFKFIDQGLIQLFATQSILEEIEEVLTRLSRKAKYEKYITVEKITAFMCELALKASIEPEPPHVFDLARDRDDEVYIDLAVATRAVFLTSQDKDLLDLMHRSTASGQEFGTRFPNLIILDPVELLTRIRRQCF